MSDKDALLTQAAHELQALHEALEGLNEDEMSHPWLGTWSAKDIVAHLSGWQREMAPALERIARGEKPFADGVSYDDVDGWNARFVAARRGTSAADLLLELDKTHEHLLNVASAVPDDRFQRGRTAWKLVDQTSAEHYREHAEQIRAWRAGRGA
jgi:hypothetical protein